MSRRPERPTRVIARCPNRIDLAGGTIDLYPLYLILGRATTVNLAINLTSEADVSLTDEATVQIHSQDLDAEGALAPGELPADGPLALGARAVDRFWQGGGVRVSTRNAAPRGSGLGASSALFVALAEALEQLAGRESNPHQLIDQISEVEAGLLGIPTGRQDYYAARFGGLQTIEFSPGRVRRTTLPLSRRVRDWFDNGIVVAFTGEAHFSGKPNWEVIKAAVDGDAEVRRRLADIQTAAAATAAALSEQRWEDLCQAVRDDWTARHELHSEVSSPRLDALLTIATEAGAAVAKLCGAGGGGSLMALCPPDRREPVREALARAGAMPLEVALADEGVSFEYPDAPAGAPPEETSA